MSDTEIESSSLEDYFDQQMRNPRFAAEWRRMERRERRHPGHIMTRAVFPTVSRWFCMACGQRIKKSEHDAICRVRAAQYRREDAGQ